jgi:hypothetical protein
MSRNSIQSGHHGKSGRGGSGEEFKKSAPEVGPKYINGVEKSGADDRFGSGAAYEPSPIGRPPSYLSVLSKCERVFDIHSEIAHRALDFRMAQQS